MSERVSVCEEQKGNLFDIYVFRWKCLFILSFFCVPKHAWPKHTRSCHPHFHGVTRNESAIAPCKLQKFPFSAPQTNVLTSTFDQKSTAKSRPLVVNGDFLKCQRRYYRDSFLSWQMALWAQFGRSVAKKEEVCVSL